MAHKDSDDDISAEHERVIMTVDNAESDIRRSTHQKVTKTWWGATTRSPEDRIQTEVSLAEQKQQKRN